MDSDFLPSPELSDGLTRPASDGRPLYELVVPRRPIVEDVSFVPSDAEFLATRGTAKALPRIAALERLVALWANPASPELLRACAGAPRLQALYVCHFKKLGEVQLAGAPALEHLMLSWAPQLVDLSFLRELSTVRTLYLEDMKRVDLETLPELPHLTGLHLGGGMWNTPKVESLVPLTRLPALWYLRLSNVRPPGGSLRPLTELSQLHELYLPNFFEVEEVARLSAALPGITSNTLTPFFAPFDGTLPSSSPYVCETCGGGRQMMTGRPAVLLCPKCDAVKLQKRIERWEKAQAAPWPGSASNAA